MKAKKIAGGFAVTLPIVMLCGLANAADDYTIKTVASHIESHVKALTCNNTETKDASGAVTGVTINWTAPDLATVYHAPIWQYKGQVGEKGCVVHDSLVKQLYVPRADYVEDTMPPYKGAKTAKGNNLASGAANDLMDGKYESAVKHICTFIDVIDNNARLNSVDDFSPTTAYKLAMDQILAADDRENDAGWLFDLGEMRTCAEILGTTTY